MAIRIVEPIWNVGLGRFQDRLMNMQIVSFANALPWLRIFSTVKSPAAVVRDVLGRFVPMKYYGGSVLAHFPTGKGNYAAVRRVMPGPPEDFLFRSRDVMNALVHYRIEGGPLQETWVTMPIGMKYDSAIFEERFVKRIAKVHELDTEKVLEVGFYEIEDVKWAVTTYYTEGAYLGEDISRFGGLQ